MGSTRPETCHRQGLPNQGGLRRCQRGHREMSRFTYLNNAIFLIFKKETRIVDVLQLPEEVQEEFLEIKADSTMKDDFHLLTLEKFWIKRFLVNPKVASLAMNGHRHYREIK